MEYPDLLKSGIGAVLGFALAQVVNASAIGWRWFMRPKLLIEVSADGENILLDHTAQLDAQTMAQEKYFGFYVRNSGRSIATNVRFQILKIRWKDDGKEYVGTGDMALDLSTFRGSAAKDGDGSRSVTLVPKAAVPVAFGRWMDGPEDIVWPCAEHSLDYYEEASMNADEWELDVVMFDDTGSFVTKTLTTRPYNNRPK